MGVPWFRRLPWSIVAIAVLLAVIGCMGIARAEELAGGSGRVLHRQFVFSLVAVLAAVAVAVPHYRVLGRYSYAVYFGTLVLLGAVFLFPPVNFAHRWIWLGPLSLQPSELAKLSFIILLAWYLRMGDHYRKLLGLAVPFVLTFVPMGLVLIEPDLGTSLLFLPTLYIMLFMAGAKLRHLLGIVGLATVLLLLPVPHTIPKEMKSAERLDRQALAYWHDKDTGRAVSAAPLVKMKRHQVSRIVGWLRQDQQRVIQGTGYQLHQSKMVLGAGCLTGQKKDSLVHEYFRMLPDDHTDFIFSVVGGQWGFVGCLVVLVCYGVIFVFGVEIAVSTYDPFGRLLAVGVMALLFSQLFINTGMTMGLMPITGMTLPMISYGGSSLVVNCMALGLLVNVGQRRPMLLGKRPFEFGEKKEKPPSPYGPFSRMNPE